MRLWSLHPKYLDPKGLVTLWRETLLARHVLVGNVEGYNNHPPIIDIHFVSLNGEELDGFTIV